ncbi:hypothetical protein [Leptospira meyeri]|uniref:hypothetical protein n=1 Tax=Leptospira meyeri TaxID=29508 RepID=UPI000C2A11C4|nr:hypothetical protein [Leptospira meyeri]PJZ80415.1 hypothetical protein CH359_14130 [Leptospira meyeri]PJZ95604.1 hypothetical protein CH358_17370 [Leptospira meyeri]
MKNVLTKIFILSFFINCSVNKVEEENDKNLFLTLLTGSSISKNPFVQINNQLDADTSVKVYSNDQCNDNTQSIVGLPAVYNFGIVRGNARSNKTYIPMQEANVQIRQPVLFYVQTNGGSCLFGGTAYIGSVAYPVGIVYNLEKFNSGFIVTQTLNSGFFSEP